MGDKCRNCGEPFVKFPLRGQPNKSYEDNFKEKTILWKNLFKMDMQSLLFIIAIFLIIAGFKHDIAQCEDAIERPIEFCKAAGCPCEYVNTYDTGLGDYDKINSTAVWQEAGLID